MKKVYLYISAVFVLSVIAPTHLFADQAAQIQIVQSNSKPKIYDLFGEKVFNRSFERILPENSLSFKNGCLETSPANPSAESFTFGGVNMQNFELTLQAAVKAARGRLAFSVGKSSNFYTLILGDENNYKHNLTHTVFDEKSTKNQTNLVQSTDGYIDTGRLQRIRIRCRENNIKAWLDDRLLFDYTDNNKPIAGPVTLKGTDTNALFRNLNLTTLEGDPIYCPLPTQASQWYTFGRTFTDLDSQYLPEGKTCIKFSALAPESGIEQKYMPVFENEILLGTIRLRGNIPQGLAVRIADGRRIVTQNIIPVSSKTFRDLPLVMQIDSPIRNPRLQITALGKGHVWIEWITLKAAWATNIQGFQTNAAPDHEPHIHFQQDKLPQNPL